jgi:uncharacterized coiled-coil DUF342 family protein
MEGDDVEQMSQAELKAEVELQRAKAARTQERIAGLERTIQRFHERAVPLTVTNDEVLEEAKKMHLIRAYIKATTKKPKLKARHKRRGPKKRLRLHR